ncbi:hypothetical protein T484DRAFT_2507055 [Baffinella frigidus]|nr:hypothetical protein T484DRAFT_2507055 [Cryptophyta sp. CCMP2293]
MRWIGSGCRDDSVSSLSSSEACSTCSTTVDSGSTCRNTQSMARATTLESFLSTSFQGLGLRWRHSIAVHTTKSSQSTSSDEQRHQTSLPPGPGSDREPSRDQLIITTSRSRLPIVAGHESTSEPPITTGRRRFFHGWDHPREQRPTPDGSPVNKHSTSPLAAVRKALGYGDSPKHAPVRDREAIKELARLHSRHRSDAALDLAATAPAAAMVQHGGQSLSPTTLGACSRHAPLVRIGVESSKFCHQT